MIDSSAPRVDRAPERADSERRSQSAGANAYFISRDNAVDRIMRNDGGDAIADALDNTEN